MPRSAFTGIELLTVLAVMVILVGMATPTALSAMRQSAVNDAADAVIRVAAWNRPCGTMGCGNGRVQGMAILPLIGTSLGGGRPMNGLP